MKKGDFILKEEEKSLEKINKKTKKKQGYKKWIIDGTSTVIVMLVLIAVFLLINIAMKKWDPTPIDLTTSKEHTLTDESKERVRNVEQDVKIHFVGYTDNDVDYNLSKQYNKVNSKISVDIIDVNANQEFAKKYNLTAETPVVIVESGENSRVLNSYDLMMYDESYQSVDIAEQKITSAILNVTSSHKPKTYFLTGYTSFALSEEGLLSVLKQYLEDEVLTYENLNILNTQKVPDDCDSLIIITPEKDFDVITTNAILDYIKKGGNILWFNGISDKDNNFENVNKILAQYGVNRFEKGMIYETNTDNVFLGYPTCFAPVIEDNDILKDVKISAGALFLSATKINLNEDKFEELKVEKNNLITSPETTYFKKNLTSDINPKEDKKGSFILGAELIKTISEAKDDKEAVKSTLIIYGNDAFISDYPLQYGQYQIPVISLANNKDVALNSLAKLNNNDKEITIRKSYSDSKTTFTPSEKAKKLIMIIIFAVPIMIIALGVIVWIIRKKRK